MRPEQWRSLDELDANAAGGADGRRWTEDAPAGGPDEAMSRRSFVKLLGASLALAGLGACVERPKEKILPYVARPPEVTPGLPLHYATAMELDGYATGLLVAAREGRPIKIEGNPEHPASLGAAGVHHQASLLQLYDPDRARIPLVGGVPASWDAVARLLGPERLGRRVGARGAGLRFLLEPTGSPLVAELIRRIRERYPDARFHFWAPLAGEGPGDAAAVAFGRPLVPRYDFGAADAVLALDADFLGSGPFHLRHAREVADRRRLRGPRDEMSRLYVAEPAPTVTGVLADHRFRLRPSGVEPALAALALEVLAALPAAAPARARLGGVEPVLRRIAGGLVPEWVPAVARDLAGRSGRSVVLVGERAPARAHLLAALLDAALGNAGRTVRYAEPALIEPGGGSRSLEALVAALEAGEVAFLAVLGGNPAYTAPADLELARALGRAREALYLGLYRNETARASGVFVPAAHYLEGWGDGRAYDGTATLVQPLIAPLHGGKTPPELLAAFLGDVRPHDLLREVWRGFGARSEGEWEEALRRGFAPGTASTAGAPPVRWEAAAAELARGGAERASPGAGIELAFPPDSKVHDGSFANNAWLQELPDPITKLTWDNAALVSPATAARLGIATGAWLAIGHEGRALRAPALVLPGQADDLISLPLGYGRRGGSERVAEGVGFDAYRLRTSRAPHAASGASVRAAGGAAHRFAITQSHWSLEGRPIVRSAPLAEYRRTPRFAEAAGGRAGGARGEERPERRRLSLYSPPPRAPGDQWAMAIDLNVCTGCSACVVACQAENNIPVVGKADVIRSREMHWIRLDRYFTGEAADPGLLVQPMLCQHCEKAPCEYVCPVGATDHSPDGLNEMIYNRCVGTRFCSNNCPYKVRRFNWFDYNAEVAETERMAKNPDVTVRARGVMEKCTFCVQRIRRAQIEARVEGRPLRPGEVRTACQQACPTRAITFGSLTASGDEIAALFADPRAYAVLEELGTEPRVRYLARVTNPNPALAGPGGA